MISDALRSYAEEYWQNVLLDMPLDTLVMWQLGNTRESCETCIQLFQCDPMTVEEFAERGLYPQSQDLACGGYHCQCFLTFQDAPINQQVVDNLLGQLETFGTIGDSGLSAFYDDFESLISAGTGDWSGLTQQSVGKSWFDAPSLSSGSFKGERYGDASSLGRRSIPNPADPMVSAAMNGRISFDVSGSSAWSFAGERFGSSEPARTLGEKLWLEVATKEPSTFTASASSTGSFKGERFGD